MSDTLTRPSFGDRYILGPPLVLIGLTLHGLLVAFAMLISAPTDIWQAIGLIIGMTLYDLVAHLFLLIGLQKVFGDRDWIGRHMLRSLAGISVAIGVLLVVLAVCIVILIWW